MFRRERVKWPVAPFALYSTTEQSVKWPVAPFALYSTIQHRLQSEEGEERGRGGGDGDDGGGGHTEGMSYLLSYFVIGREGRHVSNINKRSTSLKINGKKSMMIVVLFLIHMGIVMDLYN